MKRTTMMCLASIAMLLPVGAVAQPYLVVVDPGHGGTDPGAVGCGEGEAVIALAIGKELEKLLKADPDFKVIMTRTTNVFISLAGRVDIANDAGADRFASIHLNSFSSSAANGTETYAYSSGSAMSFDQRDKIQAELLAAWGLKDRGGKTAGFYVIKNTGMPATLTETGFISSCNVDVPVLSNPSKQASGAKAHHIALRLSLGLSGDSVDPPVDPLTDGELKGVAFEDQGVGTDDMSVRLPGTFVEVLNSNGDVVEEMVAAGADAAWSFTVTPGEYIVRASLAGYKTAQKSCQVGGGDIAWCSIGLFADDPPDPTTGGDSATGAGDTTTSGGDTTTSGGDTTTSGGDTTTSGGESTSTTAGDAATTTTDGEGETGGTTEAVEPETTGGDDFSSTGGVETSSASGEASTGGEATATVSFGDTGGGTPQTTAGPRAIQQGGCTAGGAGHVGGAWVLFGLLLLIRFRGAFLTVALWGAIGCTQASTPVPPETTVQIAPLASGQAAVTAVLHVTRATGLAAPAWSANGQEPLARNSGLAAPAWSPNGQELLVSNSKLDRLMVVAAGGGELRLVKRARRGGWGAYWVSDTAIAYRGRQQPLHAVPMFACDLSGVPVAPPANPNPGVWARATRHKVELRIGQKTRVLTTELDRYCCARVWDAGRVVTFQGATSGLWIYEVERERLTRAGQGVHATVSGDVVVFETSDGDGHHFAHSALKMVVLGATPTVTALQTPENAAWPALGPNDRLAFVTPAGLFTARLPVRE